MRSLQTSRLILRSFELADADALNAVFGDADVMRYGSGVQTPQWVRSWVNRWIDELYDEFGFGMRAVALRSSQVVIGYCGLSRHAGRCAADETEVGFRLARDFWGQGLATEAAVAVRDEAFGELRLPKLIALVDPQNRTSLRVIEKLGMSYERDVMLDGYDHPDHVYSIQNHGR
jgi:RimJ/RimL family protein N-acetyltransferase